jgi:UDP-glucuronate 4-epimerase
MQTVLVTGSAGFIGFHVSARLLALGCRVVGIDNMNDYYDPKLKLYRNAILQKEENYSFYQGDICDLEKLQKIFSENEIGKICHLAAQAGVFFSSATIL